MIAGQRRRAIAQVVEGVFSSVVRHSAKRDAVRKYVVL
jgi:hypothetical protein